MSRTPSHVFQETEDKKISVASFVVHETHVSYSIRHALQGRCAKTCQHVSLSMRDTKSSGQDITTTKNTTTNGNAKYFKQNQNKRNAKNMNSPKIPRELLCFHWSLRKKKVLDEDSFSEMFFCQSNAVCLSKSVEQSKKRKNEVLEFLSTLFSRGLFQKTVLMLKDLFSFSSTEIQVI